MAATALGKRNLDNSSLEALIVRAKEWAMLQGVQMIPTECHTTDCGVVYAPMTLFPSVVPMAVMQTGKALQREYNRLMHRVAHDHEFLEQSLKNVVTVDPFTKMLWDIYCTVREEGQSQRLSLGLFRNDFMLDTKSKGTAGNGRKAFSGVSLKQIEFNTIASSFAGLASGIWNVHRYTMTQAGVDFNDDQIPINIPSYGFAQGLAKAWERYGNQEAVVLLVQQENERNRFDQKWLEKQLFEFNRKIPVEYISLQNAWAGTELNMDKCLCLNGKEVAVIYYRDGYSPGHYKSSKEVEVRLMFERSRAIKCPSIQCQLAGCKKIQQALAAPGAVERFIQDAGICQRIRETFAGQYSLDQGEEGDRAIEMAIENPDRFVLKPQREGGGNNIYGKDICVQLNKMQNSSERSAYILMERIFPWPQKNHLLKQGKDWTLRDVITEIGIYGVYLGSSTEEVMNEEVGHLLRTKSSDDNEGGIVAGFATIDSPFLVHDDQIL